MQETQHTQQTATQITKTITKNIETARMLIDKNTKNSQKQEQTFIKL